MAEPALGPDDRPILTVGEVNRRVSALLEQAKDLRDVWVRGELSGWNGPHHNSGHCYFRLKDDQGEIDCVVWRGNAQRLDLAPFENGLEVLARASPGLYEKQGRFQLYINDLLPAGQGDLYLEFQRLKRQLGAEGLFDEERKRPLPRFAEHVGVVTSRSAAAFHDVLNVLERRSPQVRVTLCNARVQGDGSARTVAAAIERLNAHAQKGHPLDLILVCRGGGSMEDLWCFNEEPAVRAVAQSELPVVSGIGHETDWTLVDLAADQRAPTPSAAAEVAAPGRQETLDLLEQRQHRLGARVQHVLRYERSRLDRLSTRPVLARPEALLREAWQRTDELSNRLPRSMSVHLGRARSRLDRVATRPVLARSQALVSRHRTRIQDLERQLPRAVGHALERNHNRLVQRAGRLDALSPLKVLARGYAVALHEGEAVRSVDQVRSGDPLSVRVRDGTLHAEVTDVEEDDPS